DRVEDAPYHGALGAPDPAEQETIVMTQSREFQPPSTSEPLDATRGELSEDGEFDNPSGWDAPVGSQPLQFSPPSMARRSAEGPEDRKSTRLNSSHVKISYAVFCLKKKIKEGTPWALSTQVA